MAAGTFWLKCLNARTSEHPESPFAIDLEKACLSDFASRLQSTDFIWFVHGSGARLLILGSEIVLRG